VLGTVWHQVWSLPFLVGVVGNLTASAVLGVPAFIHLHRKLDRHHSAVMAAQSPEDPPEP